MENISFVDSNFLNLHPLDENNIIEYFSNSPFYDSSCNNEVLKMQSQYTGNKINQQVDKLRGVYFILHHKNEENTLFIIRKSNNTGEEHIHLNFYYVIHGHVYEAPTDVSLYSVRSTEVFWELNKLMDLYVEDLSFDPFGVEETTSKDAVEDNELTIIRDIFEVFNKNKST